MFDLKSYRARLPWIPVGLAALALAVRLFLLVDRYAVNIFFSDQWEFNEATLFETHSWWQVFTWQHGPHRQGAGGVLAKLIEPHFQWDSRIESFVVAAVFVLAMLLALWLKWRLAGALDYYDVVIPSLFLTATQCEAIFGAANFAHGSLPLLLIVVYCLAWTVQSALPRLAAVLAVNFLLIFTGFGLLMGPITPIAIVASLLMSPADRRRIAMHAAAAAVALLSLAAFFLNYTWNPAVSCYDSVLVRRSPADYAHFAALIYANYLGFDGMSSRHPELWGALLLVFFVAIAAAVARDILRSEKQAQHSAAPVVALVLVAFSLLFCLATARGRLCLGFSAAQESRYMPYLTPGFLGSYFYLSRTLSARWVRHAALAAFLLVAAYASWPVHRGDQMEMAGFQSSKLRWKQCYLDRKDPVACSRETRVRIANPPETPHLQGKLGFLERQRLNLFDGR